MFSKNQLQYYQNYKNFETKHNLFLLFSFYLLEHKVKKVEEYNDSHTSSIAQINYIIIVENVK